MCYSHLNQFSRLILSIVCFCIISMLISAYGCVDTMYVPVDNSRTNSRSDTGEAANESS